MSEKTNLFVAIARAISARDNCRNSGNSEWEEKHSETIENLCRQHLPNGSGFDAGVKLDDTSTPEKLIFRADFHHLNDGGFYDGWTTHNVTITSSLVHGINIRVSGRDRNGIKDYIADTFAAIGSFVEVQQ
jgi:hypothetical protein